MTPNELPEMIKVGIKKEAVDAKFHKSQYTCYGMNYLDGYEDGYEAGATAWAPWFVKHNAIESELHGVRAENDRLKKSNKELQAQAQRMADVLEWIKTYGPCDSLTVNFIDKTLQQFKDGKGKGSVVGKCTKCGRHYPHANESGMCVKCGKEVGNGIH